jgi:hypothetical protein
MMAKTIKNYTSGIPASSSMARIEEMLVKAGARDIHKSYNNNMECDAIIFVMIVPGVVQPLYFKLPAKVEACYNALWKIHCKSVKRPQEATKKTIREQSARTAWKIIHDWVELQLTLIELEQAEPMELFLPYVYNPDSKETFFEHARSMGFKQLTNG